MNIIMHIGNRKTGTTSFQMLLAANRNALAAAGYHYPEGAHPFSYNQSVSMTILMEGATNLEGVKSWFEGNHHTLIVSSESISAGQPDRITELIRLFAARGDLHVLQVMRDWRTGLRSQYGNNILFGDSIGWFAYLRAASAGFAANPELDPVQITRACMKGGARVTALPYDSQTIVTRLCDVAGLNNVVAAPKVTVRKNESFGMARLELTRLYNRAFTASEGKATDGWLRMRMGGPKPPWRALPHAKMAAIVKTPTFATFADWVRTRVRPPAPSEMPPVAQWAAHTDAGLRELGQSGLPAGWLDRVAPDAFAGPDLPDDDLPDHARELLDVLIDTDA